MTDTEHYQSLISHRDQMMLKLEKFQEFLNEFAESDDSSILRLRYDYVKPLLKTYDRIIRDIGLISKDEAEGGDSFDELYFSCLAKAETLLKRDSANKDRESRASSVRSCDDAFPIRLPTINLPPFAGQYDQWQSFSETFKALIHDNENLSKVQKMHYLKASLKGDASKLLETLSISADNYDSGWDLLKNRFENKRVIIKTHVGALLNLPATVKNDPRSLRSLIDSATLNLKSLKNLGLPTEHWDVLVIFILTSKLDFHTKCMNGTYETKKIGKVASCVAVNTAKCGFCKKDHYISQCKTFAELSVEARSREARNCKLCINCLKQGHFVIKCSSKQGCTLCGRRHHTLLHLPVNETVVDAVTEGEPQASTSTVANVYRDASQILLSTAVVHVLDKRGNKHEVRALIDAGAQTNLITRNVCERLKLNIKESNLIIGGVGNSTKTVTQSANVQFKSRYNGFGGDIECFILPKITNDLPTISLRKEQFKIPKSIRLADPNFNRTGPVDLLLNAEVFWSVLCVGQLKLDDKLPYLQKTQLGWVVGGKMQCPQVSLPVTSATQMLTTQTLSRQLSKFWEVEEAPTDNQVTPMSAEESMCEEHYKATYKRTTEGRFVVQLPLRPDSKGLGETRDIALKRFITLEQRLKRDHTLRNQYDNFMAEYLSLGHMELVSDTKTTPTSYLPHHAVQKEDSSTTKLRVVFDASVKSTTGISLNDTLMVGPNLQDDLFSILCRFRSYRYALCADIEKMYRQVLVDPAQRDLQRILWRSTENEPVQAYRLCTVTYGTASASFLAIKSLQQTAVGIKETSPTVHKIIMRDFYVDDLLTGFNDLVAAQRVKKQLSRVLRGGGFTLRKWASNNAELIGEAGSKEQNSITIDPVSDLKTLGIKWNCSRDHFTYTVAKPTSLKKATKRDILSTIAKIFDPLGLVAPVIITAKILIQTLWSLKIDWDESPSCVIHTQWNRFKEQLCMLERLRIPRYVRCGEDARYKLYGFCDASQKAYAACVYVKTHEAKGERMTLLCARARVAPLKTATLPRLELCAALLLSKLINKIAKTMDKPVSHCYCWTDSTIVLAWISSAPNRWQTFVANRVAQIQTLTNVANWGHIDTRNNLADLPSRGIEVEALLNSKLWWHGPQLQHLERVDRMNLAADTELPQQRKQAILVTNELDARVLERFSSFHKLQRVLAWCLRFVKNCKNKSNANRVASLTRVEIKDATLVIIKAVQASSFTEELRLLKNGKELSRSSKLLSLSPFLHQDGTIRVGGRIRNAYIPFDARHPMILPDGHPVSKLIIRCEHDRQLHAGPQATLNAVRQRYWPVIGRNAVRSVIHNCVKCCRAKPQTYKQIMSDLPAKRLEQPLRPFVNCGLDFGGPIFVKEGAGRGKRAVRSYICLFVCFSTKAVHLELVGSLSTEAFLSALKRFVSRRGAVANIYCDNATNFVGAQRELRNLFKQAEGQIADATLANELKKHNIEWHFSPPGAPHFNGLSEAGIKSAKYLLVRAVTGNCLTFEEMYTLLTQIEACLNSRPLTPLSSCPDDFTPLTPGHFLIGGALNAPVDPNLTEAPLGRLSRWQQVERMRQTFWRRWSREYLNTVTQRGKWKGRSATVPRKDDVVILKEDNLPPLQWRLGRITEVCPGADGLVRVVKVKTRGGDLTRAINKICVLPVEI